MVSLESENTHPEETALFEQPLVIHVNPYSEDFNPKLAYLYGHLNDRSFIDGVQFWRPLVTWDGVDKLGQRKFVSLVPTYRESGLTGAHLIFPNSQPRSTNEEELLTKNRIKMTIIPKNSDRELFVGSAQQFLVFFQSACKAIEECLTPRQVMSAAELIQKDFGREAAHLKRNSSDKKFKKYEENLYRSFLQVLSFLKFSAY